MLLSFFVGIATSAVLACDRGKRPTFVYTWSVVGRSPEVFSDYKKQSKSYQMQLQLL